MLSEGRQDRIMVKKLGFGVRNVQIIVLALLVSSCLIWASYLISLKLSFLICKMGILLQYPAFVAFVMIRSDNINK